MINPLLTKLVRSRWLAGFFCAFVDLDSVSVKKEPGQYPAILTSRLVNNPYKQLDGVRQSDISCPTMKTQSLQA